MRLSEAIMLGSTLRPQTFTTWRDTVGTCAVGAALDAIGKEHGLSSDVIAAWPWVFDSGYPCPAKCGMKSRAGSIMIHLNDDHRWTRERIAEYVATIEPKEPETALDADEYTIMEKVRDEAVSD